MLIIKQLAISSKKNAKILKKSRPKVIQHIKKLRTFATF